MLDGIAVVNQGVQTGVATNRVLGTRDVVGDGCRKNDDGDLESVVVASGLAKLRDGCESLETTDNEESIDLVVGKGVRDTIVVLGRSSTVGSNLGTTLAGPVLGVEPLDLADRGFLILVVAGESRETVVEGERSVTTGKTVGSGGTGGSVHTTSGGSDMDDTNTHALYSC